MTDYYVRHDGSNTSPYDTWAKAATTVYTATLLAGTNDRILVDSDHAETISSNTTWSIGTAGASASPCKIISVDKDSSDAYDPAATTTQFTISSTAVLEIDGSTELYGLKFAHTGSTTDALNILCAYNEYLYAQDCTFDWSSSSNASEMVKTNSTLTLYKNCDFTFPSGANGRFIELSGWTELVGCTFTAGGTGSVSIVQAAGGFKGVVFIGCDFSGCVTNDWGWPINSASDSDTMIHIGCIAPPNATDFFTPYIGKYIWSETDTTSGNSIARNTYFPRTGNDDAATCVTDTGTYRVGGATFDGSTNYCYVLSGTADKDTFPFESACEWNQVYVADTGSTTFTVYIANTVGDLDDTECWMELEYFGSSSNTLRTRATDGETDPTVAIGSGTNQTDDTASTWSPSKTYMQKLSVTVTIGRAGMVRWRVCTRVATDIYIDPRIGIT